MQNGNLWLARDEPYQARTDFESALTHFPDHPAAIVGLSNILMDIYSEDLLPPSAVPGLDLLADIIAAATSSPSGFPVNPAPSPSASRRLDSATPTLPTQPLGLASSSSSGETRSSKIQAQKRAAAAEDATILKMINGNGNGNDGRPSSSLSAGYPPPKPLLGPELPPPHEATSLPLVDRLAARDRAYMLLSGLTKLGTGWNDAEAWFALARAYEESGQLDKAKDALWWCVELEDHTGAREWGCVGAGGYVL